MARKVGFGGTRRSVLGRSRARDPHQGRGAGDAARFDWGIFLGFALLLGVPLLFVVIGAYPMLGALSFPERAHEAQAEVTGRSAVRPPGGPERITSITVQYETRIGARLTSELATQQDLSIGSTVIVFYDPDSPRYVRFSREVSFDQALERVGDRIYFSYFALGFIALVLLMLILVFARRRGPG